MWLFCFIRSVNSEYVTSGWPARSSPQVNHFYNKPCRKTLLFCFMCSVNDEYVTSGWPARSSPAGGATYTISHVARCGFFVLYALWTVNMSHQDGLPVRVRRRDAYTISYVELAALHFKKNNLRELKPPPLSHLSLVILCAIQETYQISISFTLILGSTR